MEPNIYTLKLTEGELDWLALLVRHRGWFTTFGHDKHIIIGVERQVEREHVRMITDRFLREADNV